MIDKLLEQRVELLDDLKHYIIMKDNDRSARLQAALVILMILLNDIRRVI